MNGRRTKLIGMITRQQKGNRRRLVSHRLRFLAIDLRHRNGNESSVHPSNRCQRGRHGRRQETNGIGGFQFERRLQWRTWNRDRCGIGLWKIRLSLCQRYYTTRSESTLQDRNVIDTLALSYLIDTHAEKCILYFSLSRFLAFVGIYIVDRLCLGMKQQFHD